ncbi:MAG: hypothetical protein IPG55_04975 [Saprospiraceae bacterium]|nr:hypothetical protein [Candidatus Defluviibacterium haderslevense]
MSGVFGADNENNTNIIEPEFSISNSNGNKLVWCNAWLNVNSGKVEINNPNDSTNHIRGRWLRVASITNNGGIITNVNYNNIKEEVLRNLETLPNICPHCEADYSHPSKKRHSPFRGFRTGFGKVSQLLSKELFNSLPKGDATKKLVAFSDSREDAAKLAKNIEEEHYSALLKEVIIHNLTNDLQLINDILIALGNGNEQQYENEPIFQEIFELWENVTGRRPNPQKVLKLNGYRENIKPVSDFTEIVIREMLKFGINPGGPYVSIKNIKPTYNPWYMFFDFQNNNFKQTEDGWTDAQREIVKQIEQNISGLIFGRLFYSFEASGLGYATIQTNEFLKQKAASLNIGSDLMIDICNSFMRILGDNYKHNRTDYTPTQSQSYQGISDRRKERRYINAVSILIKKDETKLGDAVFAILENNHHRGGVIEINNLYVKVVNRQTQYYKCNHCGTVHLHKSGGVCVFCFSNLNPQPQNSTVENLWSENYLTANLNKPYKPFRLHTEELTGQTDDQLLRQRQFKNIFLNSNDQLIQQIDILSVTTTLEVGVDIGALQAIFLANMPPQRFNYQQRVGRTGRRGQLYSFSLTFARGRSHDEFYFENPLSITGDKPPQPFLSLDQERIFKRMLAKAVLRFLFKHLNLSNVGNSVHGEFGFVDNYNQTNLQTIIDDDLANSNSVIKRIFNSLNIGIYTAGQLIKFDFTKFENWIKSLPFTITQQIANSTSGELSELLAESGMLPMGGMPTRIRNLIHGFKKSNDGNEGYDTQSIDRDLGTAIYEFAPGAQKTKDKGVIHAIGFSPNIQGIELIRNGNSSMLQPKTLQNDAFTERKWLIQNNETKSIKSEPFNNVSEEQYLKDNNPNCNVFVGAVPAAFRTDFSYPKDSNEDFDFNLSKPLTFAETKINPESDSKSNYTIKYAQQELTWKINNNGGDLFEGQYVSHQRYGATFNQQWISNNFISLFNNPSGNVEKLALASSKVTEVFRIEPQQLDFGLDINPFHTDIFKSASSKGAFYSAAFLLQRTLADYLDVDPEEIEIAAIESYALPEMDGVIGRNSASIVLSDELPNGSGFIQQLFNNFEKYLQEVRKSKTASR